MSRPLTVLFTNNTLAHRAGSELYVRDVALGLLDRGHTPIAYSSHLGEVAEELRRATVPVVQDLALLGRAPDLIHGQHHVETMTALLHFPGVPAVSFCHGWLPWEEMPPRFPRIFRYVAVDHTCRDRLVCEQGIPEERVRLLFNFVDLKRFSPRPPLPPRPQRALVFSNYAAESNYLPIVRQACARAGLTLDVIGLGVGTTCPRPEEMLGSYDIVFAKAKAALEALAVGCAVILCDWAGMGPMVTRTDLDRLRPLNFGIRSMPRPVTEEALLGEIARYDPVEAALVTQHIRATAGRDAALDQLLGIYDEVLEAARRAPAFDRDAEYPAAAAYLRSVSPALQRTCIEPLQRECHRLAAEIARLYHLEESHHRLLEERGQLQAEIAALQHTLSEAGRVSTLAHHLARECKHWCQRQVSRARRRAFGLRTLLRGPAQ